VSAENFEKIQDLFESALLMDETQRDQFLDKTCGKNKKLAKELRSLLSAQQYVDNVMPRVGNSHLRLAQTDCPYDLVGPYQLVKTLGSGGMGVVYKAFDIRLERYVALKFLPSVLSDDENAKKRLIREAKSASALDHQNICTIYDIGEYNEDQLYIAMAYYAGASIEQYLLQQKFSVEKTLDIIQQLLDGLLTAHSKGIYHRDIKPANLLLTHEGNLKIVDFGIAITKNYKGTDTGIQAGSVLYMSPEQIRGEKSDAQSDLWGCSVIFYELLTGRQPFTGNSMPEIVNKVLNSPNPSLCKIRPELPAAVDKWFERALAKKEADRFPNTNTYVNEFMNLKDGLTTLLSVKKNMAKKKSAKQMDKPVNFNPSSDAKISIHAVICAIELSNYMNLSTDIDDDSFKNLISAYIQTLETVITEYNGFVHALKQDTFIVKYPVKPNSDTETVRRSAIEACLNIKAHVKGLSELYGETLNCRIALDTLLSDESHDLENSIQRLEKILNVTDDDSIFIDAGLKSHLEQHYDLEKVDSDKISTEFSQLWKIVSAKLQVQEETSENVTSDSNVTDVTDVTDVTKDPIDTAFEPGMDAANKETFMPSLPSAIENEMQIPTQENDANKVQKPKPKPTLAGIASEPSTALENSFRGPFVGRLAELDKIQNVLQQCQSIQKLHLNFISGDVGVGSKYLAKKILSVGHLYNFKTYSVAHYDFGVTEDLEPVNALVKKILIDLHPKKTSAEHSLVSNALLLNCIDSSEIPALHDLLGLSLSKTDLRKYRLLSHSKRQQLQCDTAARILGFASAKQAILVNVYNLHLAKSESLVMLANLLGKLQSATMVFNLTTLKNASKLIRFKSMCPDIIYINDFDLDAMSTAETGQLIGKCGGDVNQLEDYLPLTLGNPLHISLLAAAKALNDKAGSLEESIDALVASLPENDRLALRAASILGNCFSLEALRYLLSNPEYKITPLIERGFIEPNGRYYIFKHELIRDLIYSVVNVTSRNNFHQKAADWYAYVDESIRAHHLQIIESSEAIASILTAAQEKYSYCHYEDTIRLCGKGLSLADTATNVAKFSVLLGECYVKLDKPDLAIEHFKSVLAHSPNDRLQCMATLGMVEASICRKEFQKASNLLEEAKFMVKDGGFTTLEARTEDLIEMLALRKIEA